MNEIRTSIEIAAPPQKVWTALTDPDQLASWWGSDEEYRTYDWRLELRPGAAWSCQARNASGHLSGVSGTVLEADPPRTLAYTWKPSWQSTPETTVRYTLTPTDRGGTLVEVHHTGFEDAESRQEHEQGWRRVLTWLSQKGARQ
jgi:uncharacterized protein YndB with AHSA1/START domain